MIAEIIRDVMKHKGISQATLAEKLGYSHASGVSTKLQRSNSLRVDTLAKFLDAMDCQLIIRSNTDGREWILNEDGSNIDNQKRITIMENIYEEASRNIEEMEQKLASYKDLQSEIKRLEDYYTSDEWKEDYSLGEEGLLPEDLKRGVLSEDGIHNLLERYMELQSQIK